MIHAVCRSGSGDVRLRFGGRPTIVLFVSLSSVRDVNRCRTSVDVVSCRSSLCRACSCRSCLCQSLFLSFSHPSVSRPAVSSGSIACFCHFPSVPVPSRNRWRLQWPPGRWARSLMKTHCSADGPGTVSPLAQRLFIGSVRTACQRCHASLCLSHIRHTPAASSIPSSPAFVSTLGPSSASRPRPYYIPRPCLG